METERLRRISQDLAARRPSQDEAPLAHALIHGLPGSSPAPGLFSRRRVRYQHEAAPDGVPVRLPKPKEHGKRRARRFLNELLLRRTADELRCDPLDEDELKELFAVESASNFQKLLSNPDSLARWEAFNAAPEDEQERRLRKTQILRNDRSTSHEPSICFTRIDKRIRHLIQSRYNTVFPILAELDPQIRSTLAPTVSPLELELPSNFHRLLCHGVAQFYGLRSHSEDRNNNTRITIVSAQKAGSWNNATPSTSLIEYLAASRPVEDTFMREE